MKNKLPLISQYINNENINCDYSPSCEITNKLSQKYDENNQIQGPFDYYYYMGLFKTFRLQKNLKIFRPKGHKFRLCIKNGKFGEKFDKMSEKIRRITPQQ